MFISNFILLSYLGLFIVAVAILFYAYTSNFNGRKPTRTFVINMAITYSSFIVLLYCNMHYHITFKGLKIALVWILFTLIVTELIKVPFPKYPRFIKEFDVSGRRNPKIEDWIDMYIIDGNISEIRAFQKRIPEWEERSNQILERCRFKKIRAKQRSEFIDPNPYRFTLVRYHNTKKIVEAAMVCDINWLEDRYKKLAEIDFAFPLSDFHRREQRSLMTRALREEIMKRDNYTCQICGKYMPDEVGLQIDHIIPVSKGGKSVPSNLQVLCSKCNGAKANKVNEFG